MPPRPRPPVGWPLLLSWPKSESTGTEAIAAEAIVTEPRSQQLTRLRLSSVRVAVTLVNVHQAKTHLSQLLQDVEQGNEVVIARSGVPIARLVPWQAPAQRVAAPGAMRGQIELRDDFDAPLDGLFEALP